ncbi:MAG: Mut7-C ubiquitin/RNAse domain-containing protein [Acidobacteriaceae bacterium]|nr:Mut7-C ubiquitin/RNAse domain-containing protein [Acidobacteriaceae bacterium]
MNARKGRASFRFYAELNDHLPPEKKHRTLEKQFSVAPTVKDAIESFGIPHAEVELIAVNGESVPFSRVLSDGDMVSVYPMFESLDIGSEVKIRRETLRQPKFVLDVHLGKLAAYLRMLGFDALYQSCFTDAQLMRISAAEHRILLTRDRGVLKHDAVTHGYWLRETDSRKQLIEVVRRFDLARLMQPFTRCMACNGLLEDVGKEAARVSVPPRTIDLYNEFRRCAGCGRVYWKGSHYERMRSWIEASVRRVELRTDSSA